MIPMNLKNRFRLVIFSMVALLVSLSVIMAIGIRYTNTHIQQAIGTDDLIINLYEIRILDSEYVANPSERVKQQWQTKYAQISGKLIKQPRLPDAVKDALNGLQQTFERLTSLPPGREASQKRLRNQLAATLTLESQRVIDWASDTSVQTKGEIVPNLFLTGAVMFAFILVALLVVITVMLITTRHILSSVNRLKEGAAEIAGGRLGFQVEQVGNDEIATLATDINQMSRGLMESYENLEERTVLLEKEIEERRQAEGALRESEEKFRVHIENSFDVIFTLNSEGTFVFISPAWERHFGHPVSDAIGKSFATFVHPDDVAPLAEYLKGLLSTGQSATTPAYRVKHANGGWIWIVANGTPYVNTKGEQQFIGVGRNITGQKREEEEKRSLLERLQRSEKMEALGQLAGGVAHDLNNVLGILTGYSELLRDEIPEESQSRIYLDKILHSTKKGAAIIEDLLTLARRGVMVAEVINLNSIVADFLETPVFEKLKDYQPQVTFRTECDENLLNIKGSPVHLEKTVMNLVSNATEAISGGGEVTIRTESRHLDKPILGYDEVKEGDYAVLIVSDTGMGIPAEHREKIFEPFFTKKTMGRSGTGLGLAIVWGTVKDHNGYIDLQTEVGQGTTFTLYFPVTPEALSALQQQAPIEQYMGNGESVLVVDDLADQREIASRLLTRLGYQVHLVASGEAALEYIKSNKADILILDMIMTPGIDGLETYRRVLEIVPQQKAILVSGFAKTDRVKEAEKLGAGAYVKKPYILENIGVAIRNELDRK